MSFIFNTCLSCKIRLFFLGEIFKDIWVSLIQGGKNSIEGEVGKVAMIPYVFHMFLAKSIKLMEEGIFLSIKFQWFYVETGAER